MDARFRQDRQGSLVFALVLALVGAYSLYFLPFTVFDGFTTFSNDAASYVLMARKWSPYFAPTAAEAFTVPFQTYPPAFSALLAISGASESLWTSHLFVSMCMLASLLLMGAWLWRQAPPTLAVLVVVTLCLMPGVMINSLGILSENLYLLISLAAIVLYGCIRKRENVPWSWTACLLILITMAALTRSVGISLVAAFLIVPPLDRELSTRQRVVVPSLALAAILALLAWKMLFHQQGIVTYSFVSEYTYLGEASLSQKLVGAKDAVLSNLVELMTQWNRYFFLNNYNNWLFVFAYVLLAISSIGLGLRAAKLRLDAIYVLLYLAVVLLWPFGVEMDRFLHPVVLLLFVQPVLYLAEQGKLRDRNWLVSLASVLSVVIISHLAVVQWKWLEQQREVEAKFPLLAHSHDYYEARYGMFSENLALGYALTADAMELSAERIPATAIVAAVKHENYALLSDRQAVLLSTAIPYYQQLCNFRLADVDFVFVSSIATAMNMDGLDAVDTYESIARGIWPMSSSDGVGKTYVMPLDEEAIEAELSESGYSCKEIRYEALR